MLTLRMKECRSTSQYTIKHAYFDISETWGYFFTKELGGGRNPPPLFFSNSNSPRPKSCVLWGRVVRKMQVQSQIRFTFQRIQWKNIVHIEMYVFYSIRNLFNFSIMFRILSETAQSSTSG